MIPHKFRTQWHIIPTVRFSIFVSVARDDDDTDDEKRTKHTEQPKGKKSSSNVAGLDLVFDTPSGSSSSSSGDESDGESWTTISEIDHASQLLERETQLRTGMIIQIFNLRCV